MPFFPRLPRAVSRYASIPRFPEALQSWGQSGKGQLRSTVSLGREWTEVYGTLDTAQPSVRALIQAINQSLREGTLWDVQHPYWHQRLGAGGGSPLIAGADQTGSSLLVDGVFVNSVTAPNGMGGSPWASSGSPILSMDAAIAPDGTLTADYIEDDSAASSEFRVFSVTVANDTAVHLGGCYIRKRALAGAYVAVGVAYTGGTAVTRVIVVNPETGAFVTSSGTTDANVVDYNDDWWFVWIAHPNNGLGNTTLQLQLRPAFNGTGTSSGNVATVGSAYFWGARVQLNTSSPFAPLPWLKAGDLIHVAGAPVVLDITADVPYIGDGLTPIPIHPPIFVGQSPADNAAVTIDPADIYFKAHLVAVEDFPDIDVTGYLEPGLTLQWREQPQ